MTCRSLGLCSHVYGAPQAAAQAQAAALRQQLMQNAMQQQQLQQVPLWHQQGAQARICT